LTTNNLVYFRPDPNGVAVCGVIDGTMRTLTVWDRAAALNHCVTLLNYIAEHDHANRNEEPRRTTREVSTQPDTGRTGGGAES
jgi:hypothetical protein